MKQVDFEDISLHGGVLEDIIVSIELEGENIYFSVDADLNWGCITTEGYYQDKEPDVGIMDAGYQIEDFNLDNAVEVEDFYPIDENGDAIKDNEALSIVLSKYKDEIKGSIEKAITKKLYEDYSDEICERLTEIIGQDDYEY